MILDHIENFSKYFSKGDLPKIEHFFKLDEAHMHNGIHELAGKKLYAIVSDYETVDSSEAVIESHELFADVHVLLSGKERLDFYTNCPVKNPYNETDDATFYTQGEGTGASLWIEPGYFAFFAPQEIHSPKIWAKGHGKAVRKVVIKIHRDLLEDF